MDITEDYLTVTQASEHVGISRQRIRILIVSGRLYGAVKKGKAYLIPKTSLEAYKKARENRSKPEVYT